MVWGCRFNSPRGGPPILHDGGGVVVGLKRATSGRDEVGDRALGGQGSEGGGWGRISALSADRRDSVVQVPSPAPVRARSQNLYSVCCNY